MASASGDDVASIYDFSANDIDGAPVDLGDFCRGHVVVIVNVATQWGLTKANYDQLQALYSKYAESGLQILAFPCNQFGGQEPGTNSDIKNYATETHGVTFHLFEKIKVNGSDAHPLWKYLKKEQGGTLIDAIKWNFTKFLVNKEGKAIKRFGPKENPESMESDILKALGL
jgi:glutathione peroxidase-family protein